MVKPLGIVAMLTLLVSGPAMASEKIFTKQIDVWGVTNSGHLYLQTKSGDKYTAPIQHCPVLRTRNESIQNAVEFARDLDNVNLHMNSRIVTDDKRFTLYSRERGSRGMRDSVARCQLGTLTKIS